MHFCAGPVNQWPKGNYCLLAILYPGYEEKCPNYSGVSFTKKVIAMQEEKVSQTDMEDRGNMANRLIFCCRDDGNMEPNFNYFTFDDSCNDPTFRTIENYDPRIIGNFLRPKNHSTAEPRTSASPLKVCQYIDGGDIGYIIFRNESCPSGRKMDMEWTSSCNGSAKIAYRNSDTLYAPTAAPPLSICFLFNSNLVPKGSYCLISRGKKCPIATSAYKYRVLNYHFPREHPELCCGYFSGDNNISMEVLREKLPTFILQRMNNTSCPVIPGYFYSTFSLSCETECPLVNQMSRGHLCYRGCRYKKINYPSFSIPKSKVQCEKNFVEGSRLFAWSIRKARLITDASLPDDLHGIYKVVNYPKRIRHSTLSLSFCTYNSTTQPNLPRGVYCVYRNLDKCPEGLVQGSAIFNTEQYSYDPLINGVLPDGMYGKEMNSYFCCRNDGSTSEAIKMPFTTEFYLFRYPGDECQQIHGFDHTKESFTIYLQTYSIFGKPPLVLNGVIPMKRNKLNDGVNLLYCRYTPKKNGYSRTGLLAVIKYGASCPGNTSHFAYAYHRGVRYEPCILHKFPKSLSDESGPSGICYLLLFEQKCPKGFEKRKLRFRKTKLPLELNSICCTIGTGRQPYRFDRYFGDYSFAIIARHVCPDSKYNHFEAVGPENDLARKIWGGLDSYLLCIRVPELPNTFPYAYVSISNHFCPVGFHLTTIGKDFLQPKPSNDVLKLLNQYYPAIQFIKICATSSVNTNSRRENISWPKGSYCILTSHQDAIKEFPIVMELSFDNSIDTTRHALKILYCRNDSIVYSPKVKYPALRYMSLITFNDSCPFVKSHDGYRNATLFNVNNSNHQIVARDHQKASRRNVVDLGIRKFTVCRYSYKPYNIIGTGIYYTESRSIPSTHCKCQSDISKCNTARCQCSENYYGNRNFCYPCKCAKDAFCSMPRNYMSRNCHCPSATKGDGIKCDDVAPFKDDPIFNWPGGDYSFIKSYDNLNCPRHFLLKTRKDVGWNIGLTIDDYPTTSFCEMNSSLTSNMKFQSGNYCLWANGNLECPSDLMKQNITMETKYNQSPNGKNIFTFKFCCMFDELDNTDTVHILPTTKYFTLVKVGKMCPKIKTMNSTEELITLAGGISQLYQNSELSRINDNQKNIFLRNDSVLMTLCNYYVQSYESLHSICEVGVKVCQPLLNLIEVIKNSSQLLNVRMILEYCGYMKRLMLLPQTMVTFFIDETFIYNINFTSETAKNHCDIFKDYIITSSSAMSANFKVLNETGKNFFTIDNNTVSISKMNNSNDFMINNSSISSYVPFVLAKNGEIFITRLPILESSTEQSGTHSSDRSISVGVILSITLVMLAGIILVILWLNPNLVRSCFRVRVRRGGESNTLIYLSEVNEAENL